MTADSHVRTGYLVIADISGYTPFVTGTELAHGQAIIQELMSLVTQCLAPPLRFVKLEGDAVLCRADEGQLADGERVLELIEVCYIEFANQRERMAQSTTCECGACTSIGGLDLKFVCHYGQFMEQQVAGASDIAGPDVIIAHRLLKNGVTERTGWRAYVLLTDAARSLMPSSLEVQPHAQMYESIGEVAGAVYDLRPVLEGRGHGQRRYVSSEEADFEYTYRIDAPAAVLWEYFTHPERRIAWESLTGVTGQPNRAGRMGPGAVSHCDHGSWAVEQRVVDWRPFEYVTTEAVPTRTSVSALPPCLMTIAFSSGGPATTAVTLRVRLKDRSLVQRLMMKAAAPLARRTMRKEEARLKALLARTGAGR